jgi:hypothetical protein
MAIFQLEIADDDVSRVFDAICSNYGYRADIPNPEYIVDESDPDNPVEPVDADGNPIPKTIANTETQGDFTHKIVRQFLGDHVRAYEISEAKKAAAAAIDASVAISDPLA